MSKKIINKPKKISYEEYFSYRKKPFLYVKDLKHTLNLYGIETKKKLKKDLVDELDTLYKSIKYYEKHLNSIKLIQKTYKKYRSFIENKFKGVAYNNKDICQNEEDFYTFENKKDVDDKFFFSYTDTDNFTWWFDIRSFKLLYDKNSKNILNPYNRQEIPNITIDRYFKRIKQLIDSKINISFNDDTQYNKKQEFDFKVLEIFQKMDMLNAAAGGTSVSWFTDLELYQLKDYYKNLEDIWNYRAELSREKQKEIVPNKILFKLPVKTIFQFGINEKRNLQYIILNEIDTLISSADCNANKNLGCYYVLIAFAEISSECAESLPWLLNSY